MKKTILATVIASASFGAIADIDAPVPVPEPSPIETPLPIDDVIVKPIIPEDVVISPIEPEMPIDDDIVPIPTPVLPEPGIPTTPIDQPIVDPIDVIIEPVKPIGDDPEAIRDFGEAKVKAWKSDLTDQEKRLAVTKVANEQGFLFGTYENAQGETIITLTHKETGEQVGFTEEQFKEHMLAKQAERAGERQLEDEQPIGGEHGTKVRNAVEKLAESGQNLKESGENLRQSGVVAAATLEELEAGQMFLFNEVDRLDSKIDGVAAMNQAALAARPYLSSDQTSSFGVGVGGAGSEGAVALGYAHRINANWTANANVAYNTGDSAEASYGAGVSYAW